jgi:hypothetical protein
VGIKEGKIETECKSRLGTTYLRTTYSPKLEEVFPINQLEISTSSRQIAGGLQRLARSKVLNT